jgi:protein-S-isoprenylcysteine O-methyltransferase Ste14
LIGIAFALYLPMTWFELLYWKHLSITTLIGVPELSRREGKLLREGIYGVVRHPRYLSAGLGVVGNELVINYRQYQKDVPQLIPRWPSSQA